MGSYEIGAGDEKSPTLLTRCMPRENKLGREPRLVAFVFIRLFCRLDAYVHVHMLNTVRQFRRKKVVKIRTISRTERSGCAPEPIDLQFDSIPAEKPTEVATKTRYTLNIALTSIIYGRVWESKHGDPSFLRDADVMLLTPFCKGIHLDSLGLPEDDEEALPNSSTEAVPTPDDYIEARRASTCDDICERPSREAMVFEERDTRAARGIPKRLKTYAQTAPHPTRGESDWDQLGDDGMQHESEE